MGEIKDLLDIMDLLNDVCKFLKDILSFLPLETQTQAKKLIQKAMEHIEKVPKCNEYIAMDQKNNKDKIEEINEYIDVNLNQKSVNNFPAPKEPVPIKSSHDCPIDIFPHESLPYQQLIGAALKTGPLLKKVKKLFVEQNKKQYAGLLDHWLILYNTENDVKPDCFFLLTEYNAEPFEKSGKETCSFKLVSSIEKKKQVQFTAPSLMDMEQWVEAIVHAHISHLQKDVKKQTDNKKRRTLPNVPSEDIDEEYQEICVNLKLPEEDLPEEDYHEVNILPLPPLLEEKRKNTASRESFPPPPTEEDYQDIGPNSHDLPPPLIPEDFPPPFDIDDEYQEVGLLITDVKMPPPPLIIPTDDGSDEEYQEVGLHITDVKMPPPPLIIPTDDGSDEEYQEVGLLITDVKMPPPPLIIPTDDGSDEEYQEISAQSRIIAPTSYLPKVPSPFSYKKLPPIPTEELNEMSDDIYSSINPEAELIEEEPLYDDIEKVKSQVNEMMSKPVPVEEIKQKKGNAKILKLANDAKKFQSKDNFIPPLENIFAKQFNIATEKINETESVENDEELYDDISNVKQFIKSNLSASIVPNKAEIIESECEKELVYDDVQSQNMEQNEEMYDEVSGNIQSNKRIKEEEEVLYDDTAGILTKPNPKEKRRFGLQRNSSKSNVHKTNIKPPISNPILDPATEKKLEEKTGGAEHIITEELLYDDVVKTPQTTKILAPKRHPPEPPKQTKNKSFFLRKQATNKKLQENTDTIKSNKIKNKNVIPQETNLETEEMYDDIDSVSIKSQTKNKSFFTRNNEKKNTNNKKSGKSNNMVEEKEEELLYDDVQSSVIQEHIRLLENQKITTESKEVKITTFALSQRQINSAGLESKYDTHKTVKPTSIKQNSYNLSTAQASQLEKVEPIVFRSFKPK